MEEKEKESQWFTDNCHIWKTEETKIITCITIADVCERRNEYLQDRTKEKLLQIYLDDRQKYFCRCNHISHSFTKPHTFVI